jgi:hypothetical protein
MRRNREKVYYLLLKIANEIIPLKTHVAGMDKN